MSEQRSRRIEQLYHEARQRDPHERAAFLEQACGGDSTQLWIRPLDSLTGQPLAGTDGARFGNAVAAIVIGDRCGQLDRRQLNEEFRNNPT